MPDTNANHLPPRLLQAGAEITAPGEEVANTEEKAQKLLKNKCGRDRGRVQTGGGGQAEGGDLAGGGGQGGMDQVMIMVEEGQ